MGGRRVSGRRLRAGGRCGQEVPLTSRSALGDEDPLDERAVQQVLLGSRATTRQAMACCPWHNESTPSCSIRVAKTGHSRPLPRVWGDGRTPSLAPPSGLRAAAH
jgi:hypothetical protein